MLAPMSGKPSAKRILSRQENLTQDGSQETELKIEVPPRVSRHIQPLGPRILVRVIPGPDRSESGLFLPVGAKDEQAEALLGEVIEVARTMPKDNGLFDEDEDQRKADLGENVSGIPLGAQVLFAKDEGVKVPWDNTLRILTVRYVLAIVETITQDELQ